MTPDAQPPVDAAPPAPESYRTFWDAEPNDPAPAPLSDDAYATFSELADV